MRNQSEVTVACSSVLEKGLRHYKKPDYCLYCNEKCYSKTSVHYLHVHADKERVAKIAALPLGSKERRKKLILLQNEGNHKHNMEVVQKGKGEITVSRRPSGKDGSNPENYLPCTRCYAWIFQQNLADHSHHCPSSSEVQKNANPEQDSGRLPVPVINSDNIDVNAEVHEIFAYMKDPALKALGKGDELIREFCKDLLNQNLDTALELEERRRDKCMIRTKVRDVSKLLRALQGSAKENNNLDCFICPTKFMLIVKVVKKMALECGSPNLALTYGHDLKQICQLKRSLALQSRDDERRRQADDFDLLYEAHWKNYVYSLVLTRLKLTLLTTMDVECNIPKTSDLVLFKDFLDTEIKERMKMTKPSYKEWLQTAQIIMVRIIVFNKRSVSEIEELKVEDFKSSLASSSNVDILSQLDVTEKILAKRMTVIDVCGKSDLRKVFIVISDEVKAALNYLLSTRLTAGINPENPFMFAGTELSPLDGSQAMREIPETCPFLEEPQLIRIQPLRKYLATTIQISDMSSEELKMVADHMNHSVFIHTNVRRLQSSVLEKTKVARALTAVESGLLRKFAGRSFSSIDLKDLPSPLDPEEENDFEEIGIHSSQSDHVKGGITITDKCSDSDSSYDECSDSNVSDADSVCSVPSNDNNQASLSTSNGVGSKERKQKRWEIVEESALVKAFKSSILEEKNVTIKEIKQAQEKYPQLRGRPLSVLKRKIEKIIRGKSKNLKE